MQEEEESSTMFESPVYYVANTCEVGDGSNLDSITQGFAWTRNLMSVLKSPGVTVDINKTPDLIWHPVTQWSRTAHQGFVDPGKAKMQRQFDADLRIWFIYAGHIQMMGEMHKEPGFGYDVNVLNRHMYRIAIFAIDKKDVNKLVDNF